MQESYVVVVRLEGLEGLQQDVEHARRHEGSAEKGGPSGNALKEGPGMSGWHLSLFRRLECSDPEGLAGQC